jgi:ABC-type multidrug transport system ATPase subunit
MLCGILPPAEKRVRRRFDSGRSGTDQSHIGYMSQNFLYEDLTVEENIDFTAAFTASPGKKTGAKPGYSPWLAWVAAFQTAFQG